MATQSVPDLRPGEPAGQRRQHRLDRPVHRLRVQLQQLRLPSHTVTVVTVTVMEDTVTVTVITVTVTVTVTIGHALQQAPLRTLT